MLAVASSSVPHRYTRVGIRVSWPMMNSSSLRWRRSRFSPDRLGAMLTGICSASARLAESL